MIVAPECCAVVIADGPKLPLVTRQELEHLGTRQEQRDENLSLRGSEEVAFLSHQGLVAPQTELSGIFSESNPSNVSTSLFVLSRHRLL